MSPLDFATIFFVNLDDTIVAIATPPGRGGIGVVRLAGPDARAIADPMLRLKHALEAGRAVFGELIEPEGAELCWAPRPGRLGPHGLMGLGSLYLRRPIFTRTKKY